MSDGGNDTSPRIYLASDFDLSGRLTDVRDALDDAGYDVPDVWWSHDLKGMSLPDDKWYQHPKVGRTADWHYNKIEESDVCILVAPEEDSRRFNRADIQLGYAHANDLDLYAVGELKRAVLYDPVTRCDTVDHLIAELNGEY